MVEIAGTAFMNGNSCVVKTLKPECQNIVLAVNEIEDELGQFQTKKLGYVYLVNFSVFECSQSFLCLNFPLPYIYSC